MQGQQTNFQEHKRQAQKNSRRLTIAFIVCIFISANAYFWATWFFVGHSNIGRWLSVVSSPDNAMGKAEIEKGQVIISLIISLISIGIILWGFWQKRNHLLTQYADDVAESLGAQTLPNRLDFRQKQYSNVVEEMAVASGLECPLILYLPNDMSINAFVTGGYDDSVAITVSQGALDYLNRDELQALIAHEFGHIYNRDVFLNNRLSAILHGFFCIQEFVSHEDDDDYYDDDDSNSSLFSSSRSTGFSKWDSGFGVFGLIIIIISSGTIFCGKVLKAAFSRQREWLADAHAVQYTRNKDALVGVFSKAMALQSMQVPTPAVSEENAHFLFINYQNKWLSTHPPLESRMLRYGNKIFQDELQAIVYKLKQRKIDQEKVAQKNTNQAQSMMTQGGTLLGLTPNAESLFGDQASSQMLVAEKFIPLLVLREYQNSLRQQPVSDPDVAEQAILAHFTLLSNVALDKFAKAFKWSEETHTNIKAHIDTLHEQHPSTHIQTFLHNLPALQKHKNKKVLLKYVNAIIKADKSFDLCEMSYLLCLLSAVQKKKSPEECQEKFNDHTENIELLIRVVAYESHENSKGKRANYELLKNQILPTLPDNYIEPIIDSATVKKLFDGIRDLTSVKSIYRKSLISVVEKNMLIDGKLSSEQNHLLFALKKTLG